MPAINALSSHKIIVLSLSILILIGLLSLWNINVWQQTILKKIAEYKPSTSLKKATLLNEGGQTLVFTQVDLPEIPKQKKQNIKVINKGVNMAKRNDKSTIQQSLKNTQISPTPPTNKVIKKSISAIYQQLISDKDVDIELAWPNETTARQEIFTFLYQCVGMKFGVLNNQKVLLAKTTYHNVYINEKQQPSQWLRIAQGQLANQERHWLQQYNLSGTPVRLFPKVVDWQLAKKINNQLNGKPLQSVRAHYYYYKHRLMLTNIRLNGQRVANDWELIEKNGCL